MLSVCGYPPGTRAGQPFLSHAINKCHGVPKPGHPGVTIPHSALSVGSHLCGYPAGYLDVCYFYPPLF